MAQAWKGNPSGARAVPTACCPHRRTTPAGTLGTPPDETLFRVTKFGVARAANLSGYQFAMPVYEGVLSIDEIIAVLSFILSRWPASVRAEHDHCNAQR